MSSWWYAGELAAHVSPPRPAMPVMPAMSALYAEGLRAAGDRGSKLQAAAANALQMAAYSKDCVTVEDFTSLHDALTIMYREFLAISLSVEIDLFKLGLHDHGEAVKQEKRKTRDKIRDILNRIKLTASSLL